jgi:trehalose 6-phosphate phosphatase
LTQEWADQLAAFRVEPASTVLCCDFDGTIADIVTDPSAATVQPLAALALAELAQRLKVVAVVSGRPVAFLRIQLGQKLASALELYGRYGAEHLGTAGVEIDQPPSHTLRAQFELIALEAREIAPGVRIEDKGGSIALHWRETPELGNRLLEFATSPAVGGLEARPGKLMVDLVVPGAATKGSTLTRLLSSGARCGCFLGDDIGDLDAFDALDSFEEAGGQALRVAVSSPEIPPALRDRADVVVRDPAEAAEFLAELAAIIAP